jgi:hypothetical protein
MNQVESFEHMGRRVTIYTDDDAESPRSWDINLATLACWHRRMNLGDVRIDGGETEDELRARLTEAGEEVLAVLPLHLYDHSGITMSTRPFGDRWDSGQVGWAYVTKSSAEKTGCVGAEWNADRYLKAIVAEVLTYDMFLRGEIYGYEVEDADGGALDSCWGFYGLDDARDEGREAAEAVAASEAP